MLKKLLLVLALFTIYAPNVPAASINDECPQYASNHDYQETISFFSYRLRGSIATYGCDVIPVYYAFGDEKTSAILSEAEENELLMHALIDVLKDNKNVARMLAASPDLIQALISANIDNEASYDSLISTLAKLNDSQAQLISQRKPATAALAILIPNLSPVILNKNFTSSELEILLGLVATSALVSASIDTDALPQLVPYMSTNPNDAIKVYREVIKAWGQNELKEILVKNLGAIPDLIPPLSSAELKDYTKLNWTPEQFQSLQKEYISIMRDVYKKAAHDYGPAWAKEVCHAFSDVLSASLLGATPAEQADIRKFLLAFIGNGEMFRKLFIPSGCYEINNIQLLGQVMDEASARGQLHGNGPALLAAFADWHSTGRLSGLMQDWLKTTDAKKFSLEMGPPAGDDESQGQGLDAAFVIAMLDLALYRATLAPEQKKILDYLLNSLPETHQNPTFAVAFIDHIKEPLFNVLRPGRYIHAQSVADHLVNYGYPESQDPTLFEYFLQRERLGHMPDAGEALRKRGELPEAELLAHGRTFADTHGGYSVEDLIDAADTIVTVGSAVAATIGTAGAGSATIALAVGRIGAKKAAKRLAQAGAKALAKGAMKTGRLARPMVRAGGRLGRKAVIETVKKAPKSPSVAKRIADRAEDAWDIWDGINEARNFYLALGGAGIAFEIGQEEPEPICRGKAGE